MGTQATPSGGNLLSIVTPLIERHEGFRSIAYHDTRGFLTIGFGTNLDAIGASQQCQLAGVDYDTLRQGGQITRFQAETLLARAVQHAIDCARIRIRNFSTMPQGVQCAIVDMIYNLGFQGFNEFHRLIAAVESFDWAKVAEEMRASRWAVQVKSRADDDINLVESAIAA